MKTKFYATVIVATGIALSSLHAQTNTFPANGSVGIGTTAPNASSKLEIKSTNKGVLIPRLTQAQRDAISSPATGLLIYQTDGNPGFLYYDGAAWTNTAFWKRKNSTVFYKDGPVGIGTNTPVGKLQIDGGTPVSLSNPGYLVIGKTTSYNMGLDGDVIQARYNGAASSLYLNYYGGYTYLGPSAAVQISSTGVLTTNTLTGLHGPSNANYVLNVNANATYAGINVTDGTDNYSFYSSKSGSFAGILMQKTSASSIDACIWGNSLGSARGIQGNSSTGIGVYGATGNSATYAGYFNGDVFTTGSYLPSDAKLKQNVKDIASAMDILNQLHPKFYQYRNDANLKLMNLPKGDRYGLIAEDVEKVLPGLVKQSEFIPVTDQSDKNGSNSKPVKSETVDFKAVNYTELIPLLIKGMQEQQQEIDALKQQVATLSGNSAASSADFKTATLSSAALLQNAPNPFTNNTMIQYNLPAKVSSAQIIITDNSGKTLKQLNISGAGKGSINLTAASLAAGTYNYSLVIDGRMIDTKQMVLTK